MITLQMIARVEKEVGKGKVGLEKIEKRGHMMHVTMPDVVVQVIEDLLGSLSQ